VGKMEDILVVVDSKGRITIPSKIRKILNIEKGTKLKVNVQNGRIMLTRTLPRIKKVKANRKWGREAFLDAGEATFGEY